MAGRQFARRFGGSRRGALQATARNQFESEQYERDMVSKFKRASDAVTRFTNTLLERGRDLAKFSPELTTSNAYTEISGIMADMKEARELGPDTARLEVASTDIWIEIRNILLPIRKVIVSTLADFLEFFRGFLEFARPFLVSLGITVSSGFDAMVKGVTLRFGEALKILGDIPDKIAKALNKKDADPAELLDNLIDNAKKQLAPPARPDPAANADKGRLGMPAFQF